MKTKQILATIAAVTLLGTPLAFAAGSSQPAKPAIQAPAQHMKVMHKKVMHKKGAKAMHQRTYQKMTQAQVKSIQEALNAKGFKLKNDGWWSKNMHIDLKTFQKKHGLKPTGFPNKKTRAALGLKW